MTTATTVTEKVNSQLVGGPKLLAIECALISGDDTGAFDLSAYFANGIESIVSIFIHTAAAAVAVLTVDITTTPTTLGCTFTNPAAAATLYATVLGR